MERFPILLTGRVNIVKMPALSTVQHLKLIQYCKSLYFNLESHITANNVEQIT